MTATARQLDLLGKLDHMDIAMGEAVQLPDWKHLGICETVSRMVLNYVDIHAQLREALAHPKASPKPSLKGGIDAGGND